ncbi:MAG: endonuclease/exonuclease/phosphatase family protein [Jatrophihabitans sp.]
MLPAVVLMVAATLTVTAAEASATSAGRYGVATSVNGFNSAKAATVRRPAAPTCPRAIADGRGFYLVWCAPAADYYRITQSTDYAAKQNRKEYTIAGYAHQFAPWDVTPGTTYYYRVRALNTGAYISPYSDATSGTPRSTAQNLRVMTYNLMSANIRTSPSGGYLPEWANARRDAAAQQVGAVNPDVIAVQEAGARIGPYVSTIPYYGTRQVDSLRSALGTNYTTADSNDNRSGAKIDNYIIYRSTTYAPGAGGRWYVGDGMYAAYQVLQNRTTKATFLMVSAHFTNAKAAQAKSMINQATAFALTKNPGNGGIPIVYGGDFNAFSATFTSDDSPGRAIWASYGADARFSSQSRVNTVYNTYNGYLRTAPQGQVAIDRVFGSRGVALRTWGQQLTTRNGVFQATIPSDHNGVYSDITIRNEP